MFCSGLILVIHIIWITMPICPKPGIFYINILLEEVCSSIYYYIPLILLGVYYSILGSVIWACFPLVMDRKYIGTAFGVE